MASSWQNGLNGDTTGVEDFSLGNTLEQEVVLRA